MDNQIIDVAKEITLAAIEKGIIIFPGKGKGYESFDQITEYNQLRAKEIEKFYKTVASAVTETMKGKFNSHE